MPLPPNELPTRTVIATLPNVTIQQGVPRVSPGIDIPVGSRTVNALVNGSAWPANTVMRVKSEMSINGGASWFNQSESTVTNVGTQSDIYGVGYAFREGGNQDANLSMRATVTLVSATQITLVGDVGVT